MGSGFLFGSLSRAPSFRFRQCYYEHLVYAFVCEIFTSGLHFLEIYESVLV